MSTSESKVFCSVWHCNDLLIYRLRMEGIFHGTKSSGNPIMLFLQHTTTCLIRRIQFRIEVSLHKGAFHEEFFKGTCFGFDLFHILYRISVRPGLRQACSNIERPINGTCLWDPRFIRRNLVDRWNPSWSRDALQSRHNPRAYLCQCILQGVPDEPKPFQRKLQNFSNSNPV